MKHLRILLEDGRVLAPKAVEAGVLSERLKGWLFRDAPGPDEALLFWGCASVHTFGMRFAFDLVFVDSDGVVRSVHEGLKPWRIALAFPLGVFWSRDYWALELPAGRVKELGLKPGMRTSMTDAV